MSEISDVKTDVLVIFDDEQYDLRTTWIMKNNDELMNNTNIVAKIGLGGLVIGDYKVHGLSPC